MENIRNFFINLPGQASAFWKNLDFVKRIVLVSAVALVLLGIIAIVALKENDSYQYLFVDLSEEDTAAITALLKKTGTTDFIVDGKGIKVPEEDVAATRIKVSQEGLPSHGQVGWEKFDDPDFTRTEFERRIHKVRAIQGELARTIMGIDGINASRVHIVTPAQRLFEKDQKPTTAAVYVKTKRGVTLTNRQIKGMIHLVSKSVEGLQPENIAVIDFEGKLLTEEKSNDPGSQQKKEMLEYKSNIEGQFEEKVRAVVGRVVGIDRVEAKVDATIDLVQEEQTISDIDPDKIAVISQHTDNQTVNGSGLNPTGIPGSKSNVPGEQEELNLSTSSAKSTKDTERLNYEIPKTISHRILPSGKVKRLSVAVIVDGKQAYPMDGSQPVFEQRSEEEMLKIEELVKSAVGYDQKRGDEVKVHNMLFQLDYIQVQAIQQEKKEKREYVSTLAISLAIAVAVVLFFAFVVRPYFRWLSYDPERKEREAIVEEFKPDLELGSIQNVTVKEDVPFDKLSPQEQVIYLAKHEPVRTTEAIRLLLNPHGSAG